MRTNAEGFIDIVDVAASRFLEEMDYVQETANAFRFEKEMGEVEFVRGMIKVPKVFPEVSTRYVMVTEWVEGMKLTELAKDNTPEGKRSPPPSPLPSSSPPKEEGRLPTFD